MSGVGGRIDRASLVLAAPPSSVYGALVDPAAVAAWLPPSGMGATVHAWEARQGGAVHVTLRYLDAAAAAAAKSGDDTDVVRGRIVEAVPDARLAMAVEFDADDPAFAGTMTMTWSLHATSGGTRVEVAAQGVPAGVRRSEHEEAMRSTLAKLAACVAARGDAVPSDAA